ncbi:MAG TPA: M20/M25/M40 family metallo-hydrolase [Solirubrobacteraceae bacterium]|nr:M20/M25/M40 family metallo-hydrolase [Solirubrobacteraceae bacterium]
MRIREVGRVLALGLAAAAVAAPAAGADEIHESQGLRKALTVEGVREHQAAFQTHTDLNGGNRTGGSPGFEASAAYVKGRAQAAGYAVSDHFFDFLYNADRTPPTLRQEAPTATTYVDGVDYSSMTFSGSIEATTAPVWAVDLVLPQAPAAGDTTSGCEPADFAGMPAGSIALMQRGTCTFGQKADNARDAGAAAALIFNDGGDAGRHGVINGTLGAGTHGPALGMSLAVGQDLANGVASGATGSTATVRVDRVAEVRTTRNIIAETPGGDPDHVVVVGAHLDSVPRGGGIQDNGSGSAAILEIAEILSARGIDPRNKLRFMWFSAEEFGLLGSTAYVEDLAQAERDRIRAMLNFDMIGSPNYVRFVYDGDNSAFPVGPGAAQGPAGSGEIERVFHDYFRSVGLASAETPFSGRSDYGPFIAPGVGIPAGGLFTGAEGVKTASEAAVYGGTAGQPYDPCYHLRCDDYDNINVQGLHEMSDAAGHAVLTLGKRNLRRSPLVNPSGPVSGSGATTSGGGGLHVDHDHDAVSE